MGNSAISLTSASRIVRLMFDDLGQTYLKVNQGVFL